MKLNEIHIPKWAITAVVFVGILLSAGFKLGQAYDEYQDALEAVWRAQTEMNQRLCRIEQSLGITSPAGCNE